MEKNIRRPWNTLFGYNPDTKTPNQFSKKLSGFKWFPCCFCLSDEDFFMMGRCTSKSKTLHTISVGRKLLYMVWFKSGERVLRWGISWFHHWIMTECIPSYSPQKPNGGTWKNIPLKKQVALKIFILGFHVGSSRVYPVSTGNHTEHWCPFLVMLSLFQTRCLISMLAGETRITLAETRTFSNRKHTLPETNKSHLKMDGWNTSFLLGRPMFRGELLVLGRVHLPAYSIELLIDKKAHPKWMPPNASLKDLRTGCQKISKDIQRTIDRPVNFRHRFMAKMKPSTFIPKCLGLIYTFHPCCKSFCQSFLT